MRISLTGLLTIFAISITTAQLKSPAEFLGYELGDKFTRHHRVVEYYQHVAENSPMVTLQEYGKTYEDRPLLLAYIANDRNMANLENIRADNLRRAGLMDGTPSTQIAIVWLSYNVHGNEANSTEASMATIYELVRPNSDKQAWLENTVVIIDPCINPDGRDRYVNFFWQYGNMPYNPDPQAAEHLEPWPGGRQNHYLFDLNRDWAWQTQVESRERIEEYNKWLPHIHVDFHEQGYNSPYYFAPAAEPYHELITKWQRDFQVQIGRNHAKYFDANNWFYFTKQRFDLLYPSYGDTYPTYNGAIGMTYEQAGHGMGGLGVIKQEGDTLTLLDRLTHHLTTGLSTIEVSSQNSGQLLTEFEKFFSSPVAGSYKSFVLKSDNVDKMNHLKVWLDTHDIKYGSASSVRGLSGYNYKTKRTQNFTINPNDLVISTNQPKGVLAKILFEPVTKLSDSLTYDITAWSVPYFYGMQAYATTTALSIQEEKFENRFQPNDPPENAYAFFFKWNSLRDAQFLSALLKSDIKVRFAERSMQVNGKSFSPGTLIVSKRDNDRLPEDFETTIMDIANDFQRTPEVVNTGFMDYGPDVGSSDIRYLDRPKVAMFSGDGTSTTNYGATWYFMEQELKYPVSMIQTDNIGWVDLEEYDILIMQEGWYGNFEEDHLKKISEWVRGGGKLILFQRAIQKFVDSDFAGISKFNSEDEKAEFESRNDERNEKAKLAKYGDRERDYARNIIPGAIFRVSLDNTHPLAFGYGDTYYSLKTSRNRYGYLDGQNVGVIKSADDHLSGFAGKHVMEDIPKSLVFGVEDKGRGQIVYFADNVLFRAFWYDAKLMVSNAIFFVGQ